MRSKLFGAFMAALVVGAFAALPAVASAEAVTLSTAGRGNLVNGDSIDGFSENLKFGNAPQFVECEESEINGEVTANGVDPAEVELENGGHFEGGGGTGRTAGKRPCPVSGTGGRVTARVRPVRFRAPLTLTKNAGVISATVTADFEIAFHDPLLGGYFRECRYSDVISLTRVSGKLKIRSGSATLVSDRFASGCAAGGTLTGEFELTHEGEEVLAS